MAQTREVRGVATWVRADGPWTHVRYHDTDVVSFDADTVILRTGGWETATTKLRMNQASYQFNLGFTVYAKNREWFVRYCDGEESIRFENGMRIKRRSMRWTGEEWVAEEVAA